MFQRSNSALMISKSDVKSTNNGIDNQSIDNSQPLKRSIQTKKWAIMKMARKLLQGNKTKHYFNNYIYALVNTIYFNNLNFR